MAILSVASKYINPKLTKISIVFIQIRILVHLYKEHDIFRDIDIDNDDKLGKFRAKVIMTMMLTIMIYVGIQLATHCFSYFQVLLINFITTIVALYGLFQRVYGNKWED